MFDPSPFRPFNDSDETARLSFPTGVSIRRTNADPIELRFPAPSSFQLQCLAERFIGGVGIENMEKLFRVASEGVSIFEEVFEFERWQELGVAVGEKEVFNNRRYSKQVSTKEYTLRRIHDEDGDDVVDWRTGNTLTPTIIVRRIAASDQSARLELVTSFDEPLPWRDRSLLAERWELMDQLLESEGIARPHPELTEYVTAHTQVDALIQCSEARIKIVPHPADSTAASLITDGPNQGIGADMEKVLHSANELNLILRAAGVPVRRVITEQLFTMVRDNAPLARLNTASLFSNPIPMKIMRCREVEYDGGSMTYASQVCMALISPYGDLYVTLSSDQDRSSRLVTTSCLWDQRTLKFPKNKWRSFASLFDDPQ